MARTIGIGNQDFETIRREGYFYIDKTDLICRWWESGDGVTLITRPRRFGKTLNMSMLEKFFSAAYHGREDLFQGLDVWKNEKYRNLQGTYPVVFISFAGVKDWYDGFAFGNRSDIYNPWSIINFLDKRKLDTYWANTSSNSLVGSLIRTGNRNIKMKFEDLLQRHSIHSEIDDEMVFDQLDNSDESAIWSLLFASGYLKVLEIRGDQYELELTNFEVQKMFENMVSGWFSKNSADYNDFIKSLLRSDVEEMNAYMEQIAESMFSSFDVGEKPSVRTPERFYHGFVLGLLVDLRGRYEISSNRESGFGRYDVMLKPLNEMDDAIILEFKVYNPKKERDMEETVQNALQQIADKKYEQTLLDQGTREERIRKYGFAFRGKEILIGEKDQLGQHVYR